ncbi:tryptophan--tRNA ligase [Candidatus Gottesmanbacteria bacterium]|nr:tryptophan--tRNA ligase [Candidatus Gottesmanbacteria bacterium]
MQLTGTIEKILKEKKVEYTFIPLPADLPFDVSSHAKFHRIGLSQAMVTILYKTEKGIIAAVKCADTQIDQVKLKALAGVKTLVFASKEELNALGTETGLVPYLGLETAYFIDAKVLTIGKAYGIGGQLLLGMSMNAVDMPKVNGGTVGEFAYTEVKRDVKGKRFLSGITPSGDGALHIGNYLGAVKQFISLAKMNQCFLMVADLHALTTVQNKKQLAGNIEALVPNELALLRGFLTEQEFNKIVFFRQSQVPMHTECQSILNNVTPLGLLKRAHAYKDKLSKDVMEDDINVGLFSYPMLMAADILLYQSDLVPVGKDQKQHIEITRDIAERFNKIYKKNVFKLPEPYIPEDVASVLGTDGKRKMSKSLGNIISIFESEETIKKQVMGCYTDPERKHATDPGHVEGNMVFTYLDFFGEPEEVTSLKKRYEKGTVSDIEVKEYLFICLMKTFKNAREEYEKLKSNPSIVEEILKRGREKALVVASKTMNDAKEAVGLGNSYQSSAISRQSSAESRELNADSLITINEFAKVKLKVGKVVEASNKEGSEKLIRLVVDIGEKETRVVFTGVRGYGYTPEDFLGKQFFFVTNLAPRKMLDEESQGMILAIDPSAGPPRDASGQAGQVQKPLFISAESMPIGAAIR